MYINLVAMHSTKLYTKIYNMYSFEVHSEADHESMDSEALQEIPGEPPLPSEAEYENIHEDTLDILEKNHKRFVEATLERLNQDQEPVTFYFQAKTGKQTENATHGCVNKLNFLRATTAAVNNMRGHNETKEVITSEDLPGDICYMSSLKVASGYNNYDVDIELHGSENLQGTYMKSQLEGTAEEAVNPDPVLYVLHPRSPSW